MTMAEAVSKRLNDFLFEQKITLYKLAKLSGLPVATLQKLYRGKIKSPTLTVIFKICNGLNITIQEFFASELFAENILELE